MQKKIKNTFVVNIFIRIFIFYCIIETTNTTQGLSMNTFSLEKIHAFKLQKKEIKIKTITGIEFKTMTVYRFESLIENKMSINQSDCIISNCKNETIKMLLDKKIGFVFKIEMDKIEEDAIYNSIINFIENKCLFKHRNYFIEKCKVILKNIPKIKKNESFSIVIENVSKKNIMLIKKMNCNLKSFLNGQCGWNTHPIYFKNQTDFLLNQYLIKCFDKFFL